MKKNNKFILTHEELSNLFYGIGASFDCLDDDIKTEFDDLPYKVIKKIRSIILKYKSFSSSLLYAIASDDTSNEMKKLFIDFPLVWQEGEE